MKHTLLSNGRHIACYESGAAGSLPLVLLHGFCEDSTLWDGLLPGLQGIHLLRMDLPGFGGSDLPLASGMDTSADAVCAMLNEFSVERCVLVGHSMGGYVALEFAARYPDRLAGLGLVHSHPYEDSPERRETRRRGIEMVQSGKRDLYVTQLFSSLFAAAFAGQHPDTVDALIENAKRQPAAGIIAALEGMIARMDHTATLRNASSPVLFLLGTDDSIITPEMGLQAAMLPDIVDIHVLEGIGHMSMYETPEKTVEIVRSFWEFCAQR